MPYEGYECLRVATERGVAFVTIDHPPINLFDLALMVEVDRLGRELEVDEAFSAEELDERGVAVQDRPLRRGAIHGYPRFELILF